MRRSLALLVLLAGTLPAAPPAISPAWALDLSGLHAFVFQAVRPQGTQTLRLVVGVVNDTGRALRSVSVDCRLLDAGQATLLTRTLQVKDVLAVGTTYGQADIDLGAAPGYAGVDCAVAGAQERSSSSRGVQPEGASAGLGWMTGA